MESSLDRKDMVSDKEPASFKCLNNYVKSDKYHPKLALDSIVGIK